MATNDVTVTFRNFCVPQEKDSTGARWYLDSDCGRKLSGSAVLAGEMGNTVNFVDSTTSFPVDLQTGFDFFYLKCVSGDDIKLSLDGGSNYLVSLSSGEAFASYVDSSAADIKFDSTGSSKAQYLTIT
jgi:hypothetical protein|tara:strand:- start:7219 stop:7602 length:384 start_codon:yes stop_codon:yes gene_type:complete